MKSFRGVFFFWRDRLTKWAHDMERPATHYVATKHQYQELSQAHSDQHGPVQELACEAHYMAAMQAAKQAAAQEALALRQEVENVMARHQERVTKWEQAAAADEAQLTQKKAAMEVWLVPILAH